MVFRRDIQGLRGIAVLAVLIFHLSPSILSGGFLGVDVFLVISGFLITSKLLYLLRDGTFSLMNFYFRRLVRLLPSILVLYIIFYPICYYIYIDEDLKNIRESMVFGLVGGSNFFFASQSSYFESSTGIKPFLHTWSLSLEMQFYAIWPILLSFFSSFGRPQLVIGTITCFLVSLFTVQNFTNQQDVFFLLPSRLFEFITGALLVFCTETSKGKLIQNILATFSFLVLLLSLFILDGNSPLPGLLSLVVCSSTAIVIFFGENTYAGRICSSRILFFFGKISYSLYLVHWPLITISKYLNDVEELDKSHKIIIGILSIALGFFNYKLIESNDKIGNVAKISKKISGRLLTTLLFLLVGITLFNTQQEPVPASHTADPLRTIGDLGVLQSVLDKHWSLLRDGKYPSLTNLAGAVNSSRKFLIIGDSFAGHLFGMAHYLGLKYNISFRLRWTIACPPLFGVSLHSTFQSKKIWSPRSNRCKYAQRIWKTETSSEEFEGILLAGSWSMYLEDAREYSPRGLDREVHLFNSSFSRTDGIFLTYGTRKPTKRQRRDYLQNILMSTVKQIKKFHRVVVLVSEPPDIGRNMEQCRRAVRRTRNANVFGENGKPLVVTQPLKCVQMNRREVQSRLRASDEVTREVSLKNNISLVIPARFFCDNEKEDVSFCRSVYGNHLLYKDSSHLSRMGSLYLGKRWVEDEAKSAELREIFT